MEQIEFLPSTHAYMEHLYNHRQICSALVHEGADVAKILFSHKVNHLTEHHHVIASDELALIMLTSLNRSLYNYLDFLLNLSFTQCCFHNRVHTHSITDAQTLVQAGCKIIDAYAACLESNRSNSSLIERTCSYVNANLGGDLSLEKVSADVFISKSHLCAIFKSFTGITFGEYVRQQRVEHARMLLISSSLSIDDIAVACGIHSSTYFATVFKHEIGMTPSAFRRKFVKRASV